jgi:hypothetical protein
LVAAGNYGPQTLPSGTKTLTIRNAPGATPVLSTTMVQASNITLAGFKIERNHDTGTYTATLEALGANNTFDGIDVNTKNTVRQGIHADGNNNTFRNGSSFNVTDEKAAWISGSNITVDHFDFYNVYQVGAGVHNECAYVINADGFTIRNSRFWNCATMALYLTRGSWYGAPPWGNVLIENNFFGHSTLGGSGWHYYGLLFSGALTYDGANLNNFKVRYNTFENAVAMEPLFTFTGGSEFIGNLGGGWDCVNGMTYRYNVGKKCSTTDKAVSPASSTATTTAPYGWVDPANHDFHIKAGSPAIDAGDPNNHPATDIDGQPRTGTPDAGADETGA